MAKEKVKQTVEKGTVQISIDKAEFIRTRDAFVTSWMQLNGAIENAVKAYINHTNSVTDSSEALSHENLNVLNNLMTIAHAASPDNAKEEDVTEKGKRKRKSKPKDPNAPKRPLTAYLLYLEDKRPEIQKDLGEGQKRGDISAEGTRRWHGLDEAAQQVYKDRYKSSYQGYLEEVRRYKAANGELPPDAELEDGAVADGAAEPEHDDDDDKSSVVSDSSEEAVKEPTPPPPPPPAKTPKGRGSKKTAKAAADDVPASSPAKSNKKPKAEQAFTSVNATEEKGATPSRKRKSDAANKVESSETAATAAAPKTKKSKKETTTLAEAAPEETPKVEKEKKERKKRKSEA